MNVKINVQMRCTISRASFSTHHHHYHHKNMVIRSSALHDDVLLTMSTKQTNSHSLRPHTHTHTLYNNKNDILNTARISLSPYRVGRSQRQRAYRTSTHIYNFSICAHLRPCRRRRHRHASSTHTHTHTQKKIDYASWRAYVRISYIYSN